ncbi:MAG: family 20 glycosylhydrolase [Bacteroidota bacterium]|nr:family 20 glycosylhydrolase [Bacteroidota bacterium]
MRLYTIFLLFVFFSCSENDKDNFSLVLDIKKVDPENNTSTVNFILTNNSNNSIVSKEWDMYWSQLSGSFDNNSLPKGVSYESINGDYKKLSFKNFKLEKNSSIEFEFLMNGILERIIFGPIGVFIRDDSNNISYDVNTKINWKEAEGIEKLDLPNSITRYEQNKPTKHLHGNMIGHIVPTPKTIKKLDGKFEIKDTLTLWLSNETYFDEYKETIWMYFNNAENYLKIKHDLKEPMGGVDIKITQLYKDTYEVSNEGYRMNILDDLVHIYVKDKIGLSHALTSLFQLFMNAKNEGSNYISNFQIHDFPRFRYRGIHLDISRNFHGPKKIKQLLDYMHYFKLNKFHLNITDDEGWRIEIPDLPELTDVGSKRGYTIDERDHLNPAYGSGSSVDRLHGSGYIKRDEFIEIIKYANDRNIELIPEINFPAHSRAAVKAMESRYFNYLEKGDTLGAEEYLLSDLNDKSKYVSAQGYNDNVISICRESSFKFIEKVIDEVSYMFDEAGIKLKNFHVGGDELPYGAWVGSPVCQEFVDKNTSVSYDNLLENAFRRIINLLNSKGIEVSGWEDVLLVHGEDEQHSIEINRNFDDLISKYFRPKFIPYVWNNYWGGGREDMVYKFANLGYEVVMSNSSAFYFDMTDDLDPENYGLSWSGIVNYKDSWLTEPLNVYSKTYLDSPFKKYKNPNAVVLDEKMIDNFLGVQGQMWTETVRNEGIFDELMYPNLIFLAEKAWSQQDEWTKDLLNPEIDNLMNKEWSYFVNTLGHRTLHHLPILFGGVDFDLPKPGAIISDDTLFVNSIFPGMNVRFTRDGSVPSSEDELYIGKTLISPSEVVVLRAFDKTGRGGRHIQAEKINMMRNDE